TCSPTPARPPCTRRWGARAPPPPSISPQRTCSGAPTTCAPTASPGPGTSSSRPTRCSGWKPTSASTTWCPATRRRSPTPSGRATSTCRPATCACCARPWPGWRRVACCTSPTISAASAWMPRRSPPSQVARTSAPPPSPRTSPATPASTAPGAWPPPRRSAPCARRYLARLRWKGGPLWRMSPVRACGPASSLISPKRTTFPATPVTPSRPKHRPTRLAQRRGMALPKTGPSETWMATTRPHGRVHAVSRLGQGHSAAPRTRAGGALSRLPPLLRGGEFDAGDAALVAAGPADVAGQVDGVVADGGQRLPPAAREQVDTVRPHGHALRLRIACAGDAGTVAVRIGQARHVQAALPVRHCQPRASGRLVLEVPADQQHVFARGCRGEDAGGGYARGDGRGVRGPGRRTSLVHQDACRAAAGHDDAAIPRRGRDAGAAGRERGLVGFRRRHACRLQRPAGAAIGGFVDLEGAV